MGKKVLIIQQKMIGDVLTSTILFDCIKSKYPECELHYLINSNTIPVVQNHINIDKILEFTTIIERNPLKIIDIIKVVRKEKYDIVIDIYGKLSSQIINIFSGAKLKIGENKALNFFLTHKIKKLTKPTTRLSLAIENRLRYLEQLSIPVQEIYPKIYLKISEREKAKNYIIGSGVNLNYPLYMIGILGSDDSKTYPIDYMAKLLDQIVQIHSNAQLLFNYIPNQITKAKEIYRLTNVKTKNQIFFDVYGKDLRSFMAITSYCNAFIGNEGGAANMAKALKIPSFIIFAPNLNKSNWFGESESPPHLAIHLSDFINFNEQERKFAKKNPMFYYSKLKPELIKYQLARFLKN